MRFILYAITAVIGVLLYLHSTPLALLIYGLGILAVVIWFAETTR